MRNARGSSVWVFAVRAIALGVVFGGGWVVPTFARADDEFQMAHSEAGGVWYESYCRPCHGPGGAPGSAVYRDSKQPVDLRTWVQRHGGKFPVGEWFSRVYNLSAYAYHTESWEKIRSAQPPGPDRNKAARGVIALITDYIISVQAK